MTPDDVRSRAFAMPLNNPAFPPGPYRFYDREFIIITYRTDPAVLRALVPEPLEPIGDTVKYEFIRMPDSTGFGDYTETGQVIPVRFRAGGREIWGFPKKLGKPEVVHESETLVCKLHFGSVLCAQATMGYKHRVLDTAPIAAALKNPNFMIKIIPHVDCTPRICELVRYYTEDVTIKGAWSGPAALQLFEHALCDVARLPVREVLGAVHYITDLTLGLGEVVHDYLKP